MVYHGFPSTKIHFSKGINQPPGFVVIPKMLWIELGLATLFQPISLFFDAFILLAYIVPVSLVQTLHFVGPLVVGKPCLGSLVDYVFAAIRRLFHTAKNQILSRMSKNYILVPPISASMLHMAII